MVSNDGSVADADMGSAAVAAPAIEVIGTVDYPAAAPTEDLLPPPSPVRKTKSRRGTGAATPTPKTPTSVDGIDETTPVRTSKIAPPVWMRRVTSLPAKALSKGAGSQHLAHVGSWAKSPSPRRRGVALSSSSRNSSRNPSFADVDEKKSDDEGDSGDKAVADDDGTSDREKPEGGDVFVEAEAESSTSTSPALATAESAVVVKGVTGPESADEPVAPATDVKEGGEKLTAPTPGLSVSTEDGLKVLSMGQPSADVVKANAEAIKSEESISSTIATTSSSDANKDLEGMQPAVAVTEASDDRHGIESGKPDIVSTTTTTPSADAKEHGATETKKDPVDSTPSTTEEAAVVVSPPGTKTEAIAVVASVDSVVRAPTAEETKSLEHKVSGETPLNHVEEEGVEADATKHLATLSTNEPAAIEEPTTIADSETPKKKKKGFFSKFRKAAEMYAASVAEAEKNVDATAGVPLPKPKSKGGSLWSIKRTPSNMSAKTPKAAPPAGTTTTTEVATAATAAAATTGVVVAQAQVRSLVDNIAVDDKAEAVSEQGAAEQEKEVGSAAFKDLTLTVDGEVTPESAAPEELANVKISKAIVMGDSTTVSTVASDHAATEQDIDPLSFFKNIAGACLCW